MIYFKIKGFIIFVSILYLKFAICSFEKNLIFLKTFKYWHIFKNIMFFDWN